MAKKVVNFKIDEYSLADIYDKEKRSEIMSKISGKETKPEILIRKYLHANGFRFRKNDKRFPGRPDILLPKYKTAILIHGCFWHGHNCKAGKLPETRKDFWSKKISNTKERDLRNIKQLSEMGWTTIVIWQCELKNNASRQLRLSQLIKQITDCNA